ncbi:MAG: COX15/CtaA family protein [Rubrivivax sp.]|nr:COX15/CtaA family protein [Rubrivivax sp.]
MEAAPTLLIDWAPTARLALLALAFAALPLSWVWLRQRGADTRARLAALTALTLFLTFDLIVFGAFTRLSDSGLGCPDWPGCYGAASPFGARDDIQAAYSATPGGPVSWSKAWIEMIHRYLAMTVGVLILVMTVTAWLSRQRLPVSPWWPTAALVWVLVQGAFGKFTVTLKLYPAVVTLHLIGGLLLLVLLALQHVQYRQGGTASRLSLAPPLRRLALAGAAVLAVQVALGGWVSTNYAVLACTGFPQCNGQWWPAMDFSSGFTLLRGLGEAGSGDGGSSSVRTLDALVAIHMAHRLMALAVVAVLPLLAWRLWRAASAQPQPQSGLRSLAAALALLLLLQVASGLSNVVLGWPLLAALGHSAGAAGLVLVMTLLIARSAPARVPARAAAVAWAA